MQHPSSATANTSSNNDHEASESTEEEFESIEDLFDNDETEEPCTSVVRKYPNLIYPSGPLKKRYNSKIHTTLFKMAWKGKDDVARSVMQRLRHNNRVPIDIKIVSMEVMHTVHAERDLKVLTSALAFTDRSTCENKSILKCRLHRRIAGLHYRSKDMEVANDHLETALQLAHNLGPDIDPTG